MVGFRNQPRGAGLERDSIAADAAKSITDIRGLKATAKFDGRYAAW